MHTEQPLRSADGISVSGSGMEVTRFVGAPFCGAEMPFIVDKRVAAAKTGRFPRVVLECGVDRAPITAVLQGVARRRG